MDQSDWACLPEDLLDLILSRLVTLSDYVRFSTVCMPWHTFALEKYDGERHLKLSTHQPPLLFLPHTRGSKEEEITISIHNFSKTYELESFTPIGSQRWHGSSHGWLISVDENFAITLSNPFCSKLKGGDDGIIRLPPVPYKNCYCIEKVILSANPTMTPDDYTVMIIFNMYGKLTFIRAGDKEWTYINKCHNVDDVIYSKGLFYALDGTCSVITCDISEHYPMLNKVSPRLSPNLSPDEEVQEIKNYIVESAGGDLLQLLRFMDWTTVVHGDNTKRITHVETKGFRAFKLLFLNGESKWVETKNLGNGSLFLGENNSTYMSASDCLGCHPNSIYFTEYCPPHTYFAHSYDMGIFNLGDGSFLQRDCVSKFLSSPVSILPPIWIEPTFQGKKIGGFVKNPKL
ncbi:F-box protein SKIP23-like [Corylus avellana]|uniref:F-box protein SKIP23-like n=1 Tax=Corylus avellana TaxID=13451 RepID=UPI00286D31B3|nr:F-box protein SKIP23-like [Corylus avellana]